jgi:hypothetical protein
MSIDSGTTTLRSLKRKLTVGLAPVNKEQKPEINYNIKCQHKITNVIVNVIGQLYFVCSPIRMRIQLKRTYVFLKIGKTLQHIN